MYRYFYNKNNCIIEKAIVYHLFSLIQYLVHLNYMHRPSCKYKIYNVESNFSYMYRILHVYNNTMVVFIFWFLFIIFFLLFYFLYNDRQTYCYMYF